jgi:hypothetical protein
MTLKLWICNLLFCLLSASLCGQILSISKQLPVSRNAARQADTLLKTLSQESPYKVYISLDVLLIKGRQIDIDTSKHIPLSQSGSLEKWIEAMTTVTDNTQKDTDELAGKVKDRVSEFIGKRADKNKSFAIVHTFGYYHTGGKVKPRRYKLNTSFVFGKDIPEDIQNKIKAITPQTVPDFNDTTLVTNDRWLSEWTTATEQIMKETAQESVVSAVDKNAYYFTTASDTSRYFYSSQLYRIVQNKSVYLKIHKKQDTLALSKLYWKIDKKKLCTGIDSCKVDLSKSGSVSVEIYDDKGLLTKMSVEIYRKPVVVFEANSNFKGEYGFDDGHRFSPLKTDYENLKLNGNDYFVSYLTLLDQQTVTLKLDINSLSSDAQKDKNFKVTFKSTDSSSITINNRTSIVMSYNQLKATPQITIKSSQFVSFNYNSPESIQAFDQNGDLIGKLRVLCNVASEKQVVFIYVNHGNGYPTIPRADLFSFVNTKSHNQFFRKWIPLANATYVDTLNLKKAYSNNASAFTSGSKILDSLKYHYLKSLKINYLTNAYYFFITTINATSSSGGKLGGVAQTRGALGVIFDGGALEEAAHELGHNLSLEHPFDPAVAPRVIPQGTTKNFMDYIQRGRNMFFIYQIKQVL